MVNQGTIPHGAAGLPVRALRVEVVEGPDKGKVQTTASESLTIGSAEANDLVLTDETVSRFHLDLVRKGDRIIVQDHGSTNGTMLGNAWVERVAITPGTTLRLGKTSLRISDGDTVTLELFQGDWLGPMLGRAPGMRQMMARVARAAQSDSSVLILGETGTGKEVVARAIHEASRRGDRPFETIDCGSMLPTLIASELFGHERGAFTGADRQHVGAFERANGGTLFLDEIGELPRELQTALLGALERRAFRRVGGKEQIAVDVRVVAATNRDLREEVNAGTFRQDLYYRLAVITLSIPPLRERGEDIPLLAEHFLRQAGFTGAVEEILPAQVMASLKAHRWPGNVRELRNAVEAALVMGEAPQLSDQSPSKAGEPVSGETLAIQKLLGLTYNEARGQLLDQFEDAYIRALLDRTSGNVSQAARVAKMNRSYLTRLLKRRGIQMRRVAEDE
ncbi:MAG: sigma 54-dependent Fis family transcriptional regulator [Deltaproteobacteria bacterium]|nr:sigma 54-dependent Fis family transcriptional regulator [Deltaproteobacteria bacterium]